MPAFQAQSAAFRPSPLNVRQKRMLANALIRIEGRRKALPAPFELVDPQRHVWVLELAVPKRAERDQLRWLATALAKKQTLFSRHTIAKGATLHLAFSSKMLRPHHLDPTLLQVITGLALGLEFYEDPKTQPGDLIGTG